MRSLNNCLLNVSCLENVCALYDISTPSEMPEFSLSQIEDIQDLINRDIHLYHIFEEGAESYYKPDVLKFPDYKPISILLDDGEPDFDTKITDLTVICNEKFVPIVYKCKVTAECGYSTKIHQHYRRHIDICAKISIQQIFGKQISYGKDSNPLEFIMEAGYLPREALEFRKSHVVAFDIECLEELTNNNMETNTVIHAIHKLLSIAVGDNTGNEECFVRESSAHNSAVKLVRQFVDKLEELEPLHTKSIPDYFYNAIDQIEADITAEDLDKLRRTQLTSMKRMLESYVKMDVFGFNSGLDFIILYFHADVIILGRYDLTVLAPYLLPELQLRYDHVSVLKKDGGYFSVSCPLFQFKDAYRFTSPVSLSKYLKQNSVVEKKSIFPYTAFHSVEEIQSQIEFPEYNQFHSELKGTNVDFSDYEEAKAEYNRRQDLPDDHPDKMRTFIDWLKYYNLLDTGPLAKAVDSSFKNFFEIFGIDPSWCLSLPRFAQMCMLKEYAISAPLCYSFNSKMENVRDLFRENLMGGLVNVYHRMTDLTKQTDVPRVTQYAPNGEPFTRICFWDFNSLYLYTQKLDFPSTPGNVQNIVYVVSQFLTRCYLINLYIVGILWEKRKSYFVKSVMARGCSLAATQWLFYVQETCSDLVQSDNSRARLHHMYYRGEHKFGEFDIDGYANVDGKHIFYEFLGDYYHPGCPHCGDGGADPRWERKKQFLSEHGTLHIMRECLWRQKVKQLGLRYFHTPDLPLIMNTFGNERELLNAIRNDNIFGFCVCDVSTPPDVFKQIKHLNFPPVIRREVIDENLLSPYMAERCAKRGYKLPQKTLIQCYNGSQLLLFTPMIQFYMEIGLVITNVTRFIQYRPAIIFEKFVEKITSGRISAKKSGNESLELAYKIIGNRYDWYHPMTIL